MCVSIDVQVLVAGCARVRVDSIREARFLLSSAWPTNLPPVDLSCICGSAGLILLSVAVSRPSFVSLRTPRLVPLDKLLRRHAQRAVEFAGGVFPGDSRGEFDDFVWGEVSAEPGEQGVIDFAAGDRHAVGVGEGGALAVVEAVAVRVVREFSELLFRHSEFAAHGGVDVLSEDAAVDRRDAHIDERGELAVDQPGGVNAAPHATRAAKDRGPARVEPVIQERRAPLARLPVEHLPDIIIVDVIDLDRIDSHARLLLSGGPVGDRRR